MIVHAADEGWKQCGDILEGVERHRVDGLDFEGFLEALGLGIILRNAAPAHGADDAVGLEQISIGGSRVLRSTVRMMHETSGGLRLATAVLSAAIARRASTDR